MVCCLVFWIEIMIGIVVIVLLSIVGGWWFNNCYDVYFNGLWVIENWYDLWYLIIVDGINIVEV